MIQLVKVRLELIYNHLSTSASSVSVMMMCSRLKQKQGRRCGRADAVVCEGRLDARLEQGA